MLFFKPQNTTAARGKQEAQATESGPNGTWSGTRRREPRAAARSGASSHMRSCGRLHWSDTACCRDHQRAPGLWASAILEHSKACEHNHLSLLPRLAARELADMSSYYRSYLLSKGLAQAVKNENLEMVQWLCKEYHPSGLVWNAILVAAALGNLLILEWLTARYPYIQTSPKLMDAAVPWPSVASAFATQEGDLRMAKWLQEHYPRQTGQDSLVYAIRNRHVEIAQFLVDAGYHFYRPDGNNLATWSGSFEMVKWVDAALVTGRQAAALSSAVMHGYFDIVQWLHEYRGDGWNEYAMKLAAEHGHLEILQWLHANRSEGCTAKAMDNAAGNGYLHVVKWLHENHQEGCTSIAIVRAAMNGHLHVAEWLHDNGFAGSGTALMDYAASSNRLHVAKWLHEHRPDSCTPNAMDSAAANNHLEMVKWLHANRHEGCIAVAMDAASSLEMVQWLHENRSEGCTSEAMGNAVKRGDFELALSLHTHRSECCTRAAAEGPAANELLVMFLWLHERYPGNFDMEAIKRNFKGDELFMTALLEHTLW